MAFFKRRMPFYFTSDVKWPSFKEGFFHRRALLKKASLKEGQKNGSFKEEKTTIFPRIGNGTSLLRPH
jgi:hypothetical protein